MKVYSKINKVEFWQNIYMLLLINLLYFRKLSFIKNDLVGCSLEQSITCHPNLFLHCFCLCKHVFNAFQYLLHVNRNRNGKKVNCTAPLELKKKTVYCQEAERYMLDVRFEFTSLLVILSCCILLFNS